MKRHNHFDENLRKLFDSAKPEQSLPADKKKEILENLLKSADAKGDAGKSPSILFKFKAAAAIAAVVILICSIWLLNKPAENKSITVQEKKQQVIEPEEITITNVKDEIAIADIEKLAAAGNIEGLVAVLNSGSTESKIAAANLLAKMGASSAIEALKEAADNWQETGENPFTEAIQKIEALQQSSEPNKVSKKIIDSNAPDSRCTIDIIVADEQTDEPIEGAKIKSNYFDEDRQCGKSISITDRDGWGRIVLGKKRPEYLSIYVEKNGFVPMSFRLDKNASGTILQEYSFYLEKGIAIGGIIENEQNEPVKDANVTIELYTWQEQQTEPVPRIADYPVITGADGRWMCDMMPAELSEKQQLIINVSHPDYARGRFYILPEDTPKFRTLKNKEFVSVLKKGTAIYGYVLDNANRPIEMASVHIGEDRYNEDNLKTNTDKNGYYEFSNAYQGFNLISVQAKGYSPEMRALNAHKESHAEDFILSLGNTIRGRVVDVNGSPVIGADIGTGEWRDYQAINWRTKTDGDGRFVWNEAPADEVKFGISKRGYLSARNTFTASEKEYEIILYPPLVIYGDILEADTNEPVKEGTIIPGMIWDAGQCLVFQQGSSWTKYFTDGKYEISIDTAAQSYALKVDLGDGREAISRFFDGNEGRVRYDFVVGKEIADRMTGVVYNPDGKPAEGATIYLVKENLWLELVNGKQRYLQDTAKTVTDSDGQFILPGCDEKFKLLAVSDEGIADVNNIEFTQKPAIYLEKWGRIEGVVYIGSKAAAYQEIIADYYARYSHQDNINYNCSSRAATDKQGKFVMEKVAPGRNNVHRLFKSDDSGRSSGAARQYIEVLPGQTVEVVLGGGRAITGRIVWPDEEIYKKTLEIHSYIQPMSKRYAIASAKAYSEVGEIPKPADFDSLSAKQALEWLRNFAQSDEGKAYYAKIKEATEKSVGKTDNVSRKIYGIIINSDGSFRAEDVDEGDYMINVTVRERKGRYGPVNVENPLLSGIFNFTMPQITDLNIDQPLDLGEISLTVIAGGHTIQAGEKAPDFTLETNRGETIKLSDLNGKYTVLVFWECFIALSSPENEAKMDDIFDAYKKYGDAGNVEFIAVSMKQQSKVPQEIAEKYLREKQCSWKQAFVFYSDDSIFKAYNKIHSFPFVVLIRPDGKVVDAGIDGRRLIEIIDQLD